LLEEPSEFPFSLSLSLAVSEKTFLIKNPVWDLDLSIDLAGEQIPTGGGFFLPLPPASWPFIRSAIRPLRLLPEREREKSRKKAAAALPTRGNDADRDLKAAFSAEEKRPGCLKRARRKTCRDPLFKLAAAPSSSSSSVPRQDGDIPATRRRPGRGEGETILITRRALGKHVYPLNGHGAVATGNPGIYPALPEI